MKRPFTGLAIEAMTWPGAAASGGTNVSGFNTVSPARKWRINTTMYSGVGTGDDRSVSNAIIDDELSGSNALDGWHCQICKLLSSVLGA